MLVQAMNDFRQLQADEHENDAVQQEDEGVPERGGSEARARGDQFGTAGANPDAGGHGREYAGDVQAFRAEIGDIGNDQRDHDVDEVIPNPAQEPGKDPADQQTHRHAAGRHQDKAAAGFREREGSSGHGGERELVGDKASRVVHQALAFENRDHALRQPKTLRDGRGGDGIWRRNNRAEHERGGQRQFRHKGVSDEGDRRGGEENETHGEQADGAEIVAKILPRRKPRLRIKQRRQDDEEDVVRLKFNPGQSGNETHDQSADHEHDRLGHLQLAREQTKAREHDQQEYEQFDRLHQRAETRGKFHALHVLSVSNLSMQRLTDRGRTGGDKISSVPGLGL